MMLMQISNFIQNNIIELAIVLITIVGLLTISKTVYFLLKKRLEKLTKKTKHPLIQKIIKSIENPIYYILLIIGLQVSLFYTSLIPENKITLVTQIFYITWVALTSYISIKIVGAITEVYTKKLGKGIAYLIKKLTNILILIVGFIVIIKILGIEITAFLASLGIAGLAIALALQSTLENFFSGIYLTADRPVRPKDYIQVKSEDISGNVIEIGWRSTRLKDIDNNEIIIPNKKLAESTIINFDLPNSIVRIDVEIEAGYGCDVEKVEKILYKTAKKVKDKMDECVTEYKPNVIFSEFGSSGLKFKILLQAKKRGDKFTVEAELRKEIYKAFNKNKIEIPFTTYTVHLEK